MNRADRLALGVLLVVAAGATLVLMRPAPSEEEARSAFQRLPSSFSNAPDGVRAALLVVEELGHEAVRLRRPWSRKTLEEIDLLVTLAPVEPVEPAERLALEAWLREGGLWLAVPRARFRPAREDDEAASTDEVGAPAEGERDVPTESERDVPAGGDAPKADPFLTCRYAPTEPRQTSPEELDRVLPVFRGVERLEVAAECEVPELAQLLPGLPLEDQQVVWRAGDVVLGRTARLGDGRVVALADRRWLSNRGLGDGDAAPLLANLAVLSAAPDERARVAFDEFHLGLRPRDPSWRAIARLALFDEWRGAVIQGSLAIALALALAAVRLGPARPAERPPRRSPVELVEAAGTLLRHGRGERLAFTEVARWHRGRLRALLHLPDSAGDPEIVRAAHERAELDLGAVLSDAARLERQPQPSGSAAARVAARLDETVERLASRAGSGASRARSSDPSREPA